VEEIFEARPPKKKALIAEEGGLVSIEEEARTIKGPKGNIVARTSFGQRVLKISYHEKAEDVYTLDAGLKLKVKDGDLVGEGDTLFVDANKNKVKAKRYGHVALTGKMLKVVVDAETAKEYLISPGTVLWVKDGDMVAKGAQLSEGHLDLAQLYRVSGRNAVQQYIQREIQYIYSSQGQKLNDKHVELIARQMFSRVYVQDSGDTDLLEGEIVEKASFERANAALKKSEKSATAEEIFLGISKVSLSTSSFLSAASFQETAKVLINAAVTGRIDRLEGLKENVIIGRLIPAGTGFGTYSGLQKSDEADAESAREKKPEPAE
jgi:DNA-directed RNA polymerase subunit beta'